MSRQIWGLLRIEGMVFFAFGIGMYWHLGGGGWLFFLICFFLPDLSILAYLSHNKTMASSVYNAVHTYFAPGLLALVAVLIEALFLLLFALIWTAHIGIDRALGFGFKMPSGFKNTHLGFRYEDVASRSG